MSLERFIKILSRKYLVILCAGILTSSMVYLLTRNEKKEYTSKTVVNTGVVSGYNIENHNSDSRVDRDYTRNELENLINLATAYETLELLSIRLIAQYILLNEADPEWISPEGFSDIKTVFNGALSQDKLRKPTLEETISHLEYLKDTVNENSLRELVYSDHEFFGIEQLQKIKVNRKGASDLLEFTYTTSDPYVCRQTLKLLSLVFFEKHRILKEGQSEDVLGFFEAATNESKNKLRLAEDKLLQFRVDNNIINYYEQTRFIADKKEDLEEMLLKERMQLEGAISSKKRIESQLENRGTLAELNNSLLDKRDELSKLTKKITLYEFASPNEKTDGQKEASWRNQLQQIEDDISDLTFQSHKIKYTPEGLLSEELLSSWLESLIQVETSQSRIEALNTRKEEFQNIYAQFAPWGSRLKKIEREIALAEEAYLENLHSFNQARLHLQNTLMSSNLRILDAPFLPVKDNGSKRFLLIIVGFIAGISLTSGIVILMEFLDNTLKIPSEVEEKLGIEVAGALPKLPDPNSSFSNPYQINFLEIRNQAIEMFYRRLSLKKKHAKANPYIMAVSSIKGKEGSSFIAHLIGRRFHKDLQSTLLIKPIKAETGMVEELKLETVYYEEHTTNGHLNTLDDWMDYVAPEDWRDNYDNIIIEIPSLLKTKYPLHLLQTIHNFILVCRSNRTWGKADSNCLTLLNKTLPNPPSLILNGVRLDSMEEIIGELPKSRSMIRIWIKKLVNFNFSIKDKI